MGCIVLDQGPVADLSQHFFLESLLRYNRFLALNYVGKLLGLGCEKYFKLMLKLYLIIIFVLSYILPFLLIPAF